MIPHNNVELFRYRRHCQFWVLNKKQWYKTTFSDFKRQSRDTQRILLAPFQPQFSYYAENASTSTQKKRGLTQREVQQFFHHVPESEPVQPTVYISYPSNGSVITFTDNKAHNAERRVAARGSVSASQWVNLTWEGPSSSDAVVDIGKRPYMHGAMSWSKEIYLSPGKYTLTAKAGQMTQVSHFEVIAENGNEKISIPIGIYADEKGVYGYLPKPGRRYSSELYDFSDIEFVQRNRKIRLDYLLGSNVLEKAISKMRNEGASSEQIASRVVWQRNSQKVEARSLMTQQEVDILESGNIKRYGDPVGPTPQQLFEKYNDWDLVIEKSMKKDPEINMLLGIQSTK
ncbi:hypothetical protein [Flocculibacter collagenilyticus]|uniref:hypothetical protein n=1 Tax=Flocculibacter collagenilyticus TaxID=2744479 RepID=UPI0018F4ACC3|nr:hypothetical protein [Flocculibacter collagenilyticus]